MSPSNPLARPFLNAATSYAKQRLMSLHPNIMVQRSPSHFQTGTFYWAHHEKLCVIDNTIAFMGGLDACFGRFVSYPPIAQILFHRAGRWDTPQHVLTDDNLDTDQPQIWPGKLFCITFPRPTILGPLRLPRTFLLVILSRHLT
jgi:hypothetical protein